MRYRLLKVRVSTGLKLTAFGVLPEGLDPHSWRGRLVALWVHLVPMVFGSVVLIGRPWYGLQWNLSAIVWGGSATALIVGFIAGERFWGVAYSTPGLFLLLGLGLGPLLPAVGWIGAYLAIGAFLLLWMPSVLIGLTVLFVRHKRHRDAQTGST